MHTSSETFAELSEQRRRKPSNHLIAARPLRTTSCSEPHLVRPRIRCKSMECERTDAISTPKLRQYVGRNRKRGTVHHHQRRPPQISTLALAIAKYSGIGGTCVGGRRQPPHLNDIPCNFIAMPRIFRMPPPTWWHSTGRDGRA